MEFQLEKIDSREGTFLHMLPEGQKLRIDGLINNYEVRIRDDLWWIQVRRPNNGNYAAAVNGLTLNTEHPHGNFGSMESVQFVRSKEEGMMYAMLRSYYFDKDKRLRKSYIDVSSTIPQKLKEDYNIKRHGEVTLSKKGSGLVDRYVALTSREDLESMARFYIHQVILPLYGS